MRKVVSIFAAVGAFALVGVIYAVESARTSDHQDSPQTVARPGADSTDMYVFPARNPRNVAFALNVHPLIPRGLAAGASFDPGVLYQIKIDTVGDHREDTVLQFKATGTGPTQTIAFYGPMHVKPSLSSTLAGTSTATTTLGKTKLLPGSMALFAGARKDPFFFDLTQFFKIDPDRNYKNHPNVPAASATCLRNPGSDYLADFNVLSIVVEMPRSALANATNYGRINVWATTSVASSTGGAYTQIERWGRPAVKEALESFNDHDASNRAGRCGPGVARRNLQSVDDAEARGGAGRSPAIANALVRVLVPDEMEVNLNASGPATYLGVETKGKSGLPVSVVRVVPDSGLKGFKS